MAPRDLDAGAAGVGGNRRRRTRLRSLPPRARAQSSRHQGAPMNRQPEICSHCGQPIAPTGLRLPRIKRIILEAVKRRPGISAEDLRSIVWADDPNGGPEDRKVLHVHVNTLNHLLAPDGMLLRSQGGGYQIRSISP